MVPNWAKCHRCWMKSLHFLLKLLSNGTQRNHMLQDQNQLNIKHVIKEHFLTWMSDNKMNHSYGLSYDETLFLSYQMMFTLP